MKQLRQYGRGGWGQTVGKIYDAISNREEFKSGALSGLVMSPGSYGSGRLEGDELVAWNDHKPLIDYVVYSYATPIAWHRDDDVWHVVADSFSHTTSRHQSIVRVAVG